MLAAATAQAEANASDAAGEADFLAQLKEMGVEIYEPTDSELAEWRDAALSVWEEMKNKIAPAIWAKIQPN